MRTGSSLSCCSGDYQSPARSVSRFEIVLDRPGGWSLRTNTNRPRIWGRVSCPEERQRTAEPFLFTVHALLSTLQFPIVTLQTPIFNLNSPLSILPSPLRHGTAVGKNILYRYTQRESRWLNRAEIVITNVDFAKSFDRFLQKGVRFFVDIPDF